MQCSQYLELLTAKTISFVIKRAYSKNLYDEISEKTKMIFKYQIIKRRLNRLNDNAKTLNENYCESVRSKN